MQTSQGIHQNPHNPSQQRLFAPFVAKTLKVEGDHGFCFASVSYNEKHNLIIASPTDNSLRFYDATTLLPSKEFQTKMLDRGVMGMSFCPDTETFIFGCEHGSIYVYNLSKKTLQKLKQPVRTYIYGTVFLNSPYYAFSAFDSGRIYVKNFQNEDRFHSFLQKENIYDLKSMSKRSILFSRLSDGSVMMYRTDRLPKLPLLDSIQGKRGGSKKIQNITINGKDYILTKRGHFAIEIWHLTKAKMRRLKVIHVPIEVSSIVYLENEKIIGTIHHTQEIRFWSLYSGKLEYTFETGMTECFYSFVMKDKDAIGVVERRQNVIKIVQLHTYEHQMMKKKKALGIFDNNQCDLF